MFMSLQELFLVSYAPNLFLILHSFLMIVMAGGGLPSQGEPSYCTLHFLPGSFGTFEGLAPTCCTLMATANHAPTRLVHRGCSTLHRLLGSQVGARPAIPEYRPTS